MSQPASPTTRAGTPATVLQHGTSDRTTDPAAMRLWWPTRMLPRTFAPAPIITPSSILGWRSPSSLPVPPSVTSTRTDELTLPHPRAHERQFVLQPWLEIEPHAELPGHGPIAELADYADGDAWRLE